MNVGEKELAAENRVVVNRKEEEVENTKDENDGGKYLGKGKLLSLLVLCHI